MSVITPSFNQGRWLGDNLRSVACQTYPQVEHIVMDGGSTDNSVTLLKRSGPGVIWRSERDRGQSHAINKAFELSRGEIIGWLNSDDAYFDIEAIEAAVQAFDRNSSVDVVYGHAALVNPENLIIQMIWVPRFNYRVLRTHNFIIQPAAFIRRSALEDEIVREEYDYCMDRELWLRLAARHHFRRIDKIVAIDRHHPARKSLSRTDLRDKDAARLVMEYGVPHGTIARCRLKFYKVLFRLIGIQLLAHKYQSAIACAARTDSFVKLTIRQVAKRRASMPIGPSG